MTDVKKIYNYSDLVAMTTHHPNPSTLPSEIADFIPEYKWLTIRSSSETIEIVFSSEPNEDDVLSVLEAHTGEEVVAPHFKIYELTDIPIERWYDHPKALNYKTSLRTNMHPVRESNKGEIVKVTWFSDKMLTSPILIVDIAYNRNQGGLAMSRETTRRWVMSDGSISSEVKVTEKLYFHEPRSQIQEIRKRRQNIYFDVEAKAVGILLQNLDGFTPTERINHGRAFLMRNKTSFEGFADAGTKNILTDIANDPDPDNFLDIVVNIPVAGATIRDMFIFELDIWS